MKKFLIVSALVLVVLSMAACSGGGLTGKWNVDPVAYGLAEGEQMIFEFKSGGEMMMDYLVDGVSQFSQPGYYKTVDNNTIWLCDSQDTCTAELATPVDYSVKGSTLTLIDPEYPDEPLTLNKIP